MNKFQSWILAAILASPSIVMAQPPEEELSPTAPEFNIEVVDAPTPVEATPVTSSAITPALPAATANVNATPSTQAITTPAVLPSAASSDANAQILQPTLSAPAQIPVGGIKVPEAAAEDKSLRGVTLSPSITLKPLGYNDHHQSYFEIKPSFGLGTAFKTAKNRTVALNVNYDLIWDEFLSRRDTGLRYFEHDLTGGASIDWTKNFTTKLTAEFDYSLRASTERELAINGENTLEGVFKINNDISVSTGFWIFYFNDMDTKINLSNLPGEGDDLRTGNAATGGEEETFGPALDPAVSNVWYANNAIMLAPSYKITKDTTLSGYYRYVFATFTNTDKVDLTGHFINLSIKQNLPWKGGSVSLADQVRLRSYTVKTNDDGSLAATFRNRITLTIGQDITDSISAEFWYRHELTGSNADNYETMENQHQINVGFTYSF